MLIIWIDNYIIITLRYVAAMSRGRKYSECDYYKRFESFTPVTSYTVPQAITPLCCLIWLHGFLISCSIILLLFVGVLTQYSDLYCCLLYLIADAVKIHVTLFYFLDLKLRLAFKVFIRGLLFALGVKYIVLCYRRTFGNSN